jgi:hypothetical protein
MPWFLLIHSFVQVPFLLCAFQVMISIGEGVVFGPIPFIQPSTSTLRYTGENVTAKNGIQYFAYTVGRVGGGGGTSGYPSGFPHLGTITKESFPGNCKLVVFISVR